MVVAASLDRDPAVERDLVAAFASRRVDGRILAPTASQQGYLTSELRSGWPIVCVDRLPRSIEIDAVVTDNRAGGAMALVVALFDLPEPPTAIVTVRDLITMCAVRALRVRGLERAIGLVGFDDFMLADLLDPAITVVAQDARAIGHHAAELLFRREGNSHEPTATRTLQSRLITRGSGETGRA